MHQKEFIATIARQLKENRVYKKVHIPREVFHISDDRGNHKDFLVRQSDKKVYYTVDDVANILEAAMYIVGETIKVGGTIAIHGFGAIGVHYRKPRRLKAFDGAPCVAEGRYIPKFAPGKDLKTCAKIYQLSLEDFDIQEPMYNDNDFENFDDEDSVEDENFNDDMGDLSDVEEEEAVDGVEVIWDDDENEILDEDGEDGDA